MAASKNIREIVVTNTLTQKKEVLQTRVPGKLTLYSCGPTVYNLIHIGNLRAALVADLFYRYFKKVGYDVVFARNYTDVDDKIINRAKEEKITSDAVSKKYIQEVEKDYAVAGLLSPSHKPLATEHIPEMIQTIESLISQGKAYVLEDGDVVYSIQNFKGYGKLSHKNIDDLQAGMRVEVNDKKRNPLDFSLWKPAKPGEPSWDSPWGKGRPGWHIECSAMSSKWLGDQIDVHHGGIDLIFPHHENEIAQSEGASGKDPFVKYWLHSGFLTMAKEKMSKSLGNILSARDFLTEYSGEVARYMLLSVHYRAEIDFSDETVQQTLQSLERIYEAKKKASSLLSLKAAIPDRRAEELWGTFVAQCEKCREEMDAHFANDFNSAGALSSLFILIREFNKLLSEPKASVTPSATLGAKYFIQILEEELGPVLGVGQARAEKALEDINRIRAKRFSQNTNAEGALTAEQVEGLIQERKDARAAKNFARADEIRIELEQKGVILKDGPSGTSWSYK